MRRTVILHGAYAGYVDGPFEIEAPSVHDTLEAVGRLVKGFAPDPINGLKRVMVAGLKDKAALFREDALPVLHIFPALSFGKNGGLTQMVIGSLEVALAFVLPPGPWTAALLSAGFMTMVGGAMQLLAPQPKHDPQSHYLANSGNTVAIGTPIPILYGRFRVGGQIMSLNVVAQNQPFTDSNS